MSGQPALIALFVSQIPEGGETATNTCGREKFFVQSDGCARGTRRHSGDTKTIRLRDWRQLSADGRPLIVCESVRRNVMIKDRNVTSRSDTSSEDRSISSSARFGALFRISWSIGIPTTKSSACGHERDHGCACSRNSHLLADTNIYDYYREGLLCHRRRQQ